jgi:tetratricopeptide (TPR) repeat protein
MRLTRGSLRALLAGALLLFASTPLQADAREALQRAAALVREGRLDEAEAQARLALADPETGAVARSVLGTIRFQQGRLDDSLRFLEEAIALDARLVGAHLSLAQIYALKGEPARGLETLDRVLKQQPDSLAALQQAAVLAESHDELERSLSYWMRAKKLEPDDPDVLLGFGRVCLKMDLLDDAEPALTRAASVRPNELSYQYTLAAAKVGKRQFEAAQALLEPLVRTRPDDAQLQYALGSVLYIQGRLPEAAERLNESLRLKPDHLAAQYYRALIARDQSQDVEAIERLTALLARHPEHAASREALGSLLMSAQRYPEAEEHLRHAVRLNPSSVKANYQLGLLLARMGRKDESARQLELAKTLREENEASSRLQLRLLESQP